MVSRPDRPDNLDFYPHHNAQPRNPDLVLADLPSPTSGGVPPALSPLDALALRGRLLAQEFEKKNNGGRRISRLPPLTIANEFGNRPDFFRSISGESGNSQSLPFQDEQDEPGFQEEHTPQSARETRPDYKHKSFYPQIQSDEAPYEKTFSFRNNLSKVDEAEQPVPDHQDHFAIPRTQSPMPVEPRIGPVQEATPITPGAHLVQNATHPFASKQRTLAIDSVAARSYGTNALQPPRSPAPSRSPRVSPSIRSVPGDSSDEVEGMSLGGSYDSLPPRQMSTNSSFSRPYSPSSPFINNSIPRSPSLSSEYSLGGTQLPRPAFNFSRPLSSASRPSFDVRPSFEGPSRQTSDESAIMRPSFDSSRQYANDSPLTNYSNEVVHTPVSMTSEDFRRSSDSQNHPAPSYTYSKFDLPRGREPQRESINAADFLSKQIQWDQPQNGSGNRAPTSRTRPPSPPSPPRSLERPRSQPAPPAAVSRTSSTERPGAPSLTSSNSTIRVRPSGSSEVTAEQHLDRGIACHEAGSLKESTYHLRLAALAGLPTGMLLYALACRHGWGMRKNEAEGVKWLRRAVDIAQLEVAEDEDQTKQGKPSDIMEQKTHKAQFAYSIYELAQSYANGWGIQQDKTLALRCYEIAGNWGDSDALTEAGFCYAQGVGCKKDMKKAAKFYRMAEAKGVSMAGNSWIYKEKYMDDASSDARSTRSGRSTKKDSSEKKPRDKSRTRTIFGRKKSFAAA